MAPVAAPVSVSVLPAHRLAADGVAVTDVGVVLIVTGDVIAWVLPHTLVAVSV